MRFSAICKRLVVPFLLTAMASCASVRGNDQGSPPVNETEAIEYQKSINRCTKTGGTRVVKIKGELRCY